MVVAILVSRTFHSLRINYKEVMAILMGELLELQRAAADGRPIEDVPRSITDFIAGQADLWVNGLWFTSFVLSLFVAILAMLVKQWLRQYTAYTSGDARHVVRVRHFRLMSLEKWCVPQIIGLLPVLMHLTLGLFFAGLVVFLWGFSVPLGIALACVTGIVFVAYVISVLLPVVYPECPYKTTLSLYSFGPLKAFCRLLLRRGKKDVDSEGSLLERERRKIETDAEEIDAQALSWLHETSENDSVRTVVDQVLEVSRAAEDIRVERDEQPEAGLSNSTSN